MSSRVLVPLAVVALVVLGAVWFFQTFERVPAKVRVPATGEARLRPFLAAERFSGRMGIRATELRSQAELGQLEPGGVLLLPAGRQGLSEAQLMHLLAWVAAGGHAIIEAEKLPLEDRLLDRLGVRREKDCEPPKPEVPFLPDELFDTVLAEAEVPGERALKVMFDRATRLVPGPRPVLASASERGAIKLVAFRHGRGIVTACTSLDFARNGRIGLHDDAAFLWGLLQLSPAPVLQVFAGTERLSLTGFLVEHAAPALAAGLALLALWLWRIAPRFGPVPDDAPPVRRRLLDHLRASGRYLWTEGQRVQLAAAARDAALRRLARAQPDFALASTGEQEARLAALAGVPIEQARHFIAAGAARIRGADLVQLAALAQRIHFALEKGSG